MAAKKKGLIPLDEIIPKDEDSPGFGKGPAKGKKRQPYQKQVKRVYTEEQLAALEEANIPVKKVNAELAKESHRPNGRMYSEVPQEQRKLFVDKMEFLNWDVVQELYDWYNSPEVLPRDKIALLKELMQFLIPKSKLVDMGSIGDNSKIEIIITRENKEPHGKKD